MAPTQPSMTSEPPESAAAPPPGEPPTGSEPAEPPGPPATAAGPGPEPSTTPRGPRRVATITAVAIIAVLAGSALFFSGWTLGQQALLTSGTPPDVAEAFQPFWDAYYAIVDRYAGGPVDQQALIQGAIRGMFDAIGDPFSKYLSPRDFQSSLQDIAGQFEGIGATIGTVDAAGNTTSCNTLGSDCRLAVVEPIPGSPAEHAGLQPGDVITAVDGSSVDGLTVSSALNRIRGPRDTTVRLTILRDSGAPFEVPIVRAVIIQPEVSARDLADGTVGYIKLSGFSDNATRQFDSALAADVDGGKQKLILDLRGNPGGYITAARDIASQFLADGTIFWQEDASGTLTETTAIPGGVATAPSIRVVVMVDGGSASASEIVAGALQDRGRATLVGTTTFGKGTIQQWTQLEGDNGGFRLTVAKWLTPDKTWINGVGLTPDVVVDTAPARPGDDPALDRALKILAAPAADARLLLAA
jgi:carboxyl-terminal processing protease